MSKRIRSRTSEGGKKYKNRPFMENIKELGLEIRGGGRGKKNKKIKRRKLKFPSIVSIANESVDIESFEKRCC